MKDRFNRLIDIASEFFAARKGLLPTVGLALILFNLIFQFFPGEGLSTGSSFSPLFAWLQHTDLFLHLGLILALIGIMLAWAL